MRLIKNIIGIIDSLPLILSDSYDTRDVSIVRVSYFILLILFIWLTVKIGHSPELSGLLAPIWQGLATLLGTSLAMHVSKKAIYAYQKIKGEGKQ